MPYKDPEKEKEYQREWMRRWAAKHPRRAKRSRLLWMKRHPERYRLFTVWSGMKQRCSNPNNHKYPLYGARGISVCSRWFESFDNFVSDMGPRPSSRHSIDRVNNDGNYEPSNCRWATAKEQWENSRQNRHPVEIKGEKITLSEACRRAGLPYSRVHMRINAYGFSVERALSAPPHPGGRKRKNAA